MFQIFKIRGKRFEYSNIIRSPKFSNLNPNIRDSRKKIRIRIESEYIRSPLALVGAFSVIVKTDCETERSFYSTTHNTPVCCRGLAERCPVPMKTLITFGSPHQGQFGVPDCRETTHSPLLCELVRQLISQGGAEGLQTLHYTPHCRRLHPLDPGPGGRGPVLARPLQCHPIQPG